MRKGVEIWPLFAGGTGVQSYSRTQPKEMPTLLEAGTLNGHGIAGLYAALGYLQKTGKTEYIDLLFLHIDWKDSRRLGGSHTMNWKMHMSRKRKRL